jgi:hypothetical protein
VRLRRLGIVVATPPARGDFPRAERIALAARAAGIEVGVFLMDGAAPCASEPGAARLVEEGCEVVVCGTNFGSAAPAAGVIVGSQDDHARIVGGADRVVALT